MKGYFFYPLVTEIFWYELDVMFLFGTVWCRLGKLNLLSAFGLT
jgi:hypothetical protein